MSKILIKNIKGLVQAGEQIPSVRRGAEMKQLEVLENAYLALEDGEVIAYGPMNEWEGENVEVCDVVGFFFFLRNKCWYN
jgi:imidazolonepropionase